MSHWAEIDENNKVIRVLVGDNNDPNGDEGYQWLIDNLGGTWIKTSYNAEFNGFRYNYAGADYTYDPIDDAFIAPMPGCGHDELMLNELKRWECSNVEHEFTLP
jgi:hypothetical protein